MNEKNIMMKYVRIRKYVKELLILEDTENKVIKVNVSGNEDTAWISVKLNYKYQGETITHYIEGFKHMSKAQLKESVRPLVMDIILCS